MFKPPRAISWQPGQDIAGDRKPQFGGWTWRYDLVVAEPVGTEVTLTYDGTAVPPLLREHISFPPFPVDHLTNSLRHLAELVQQALANGIWVAVAEHMGSRHPLGRCRCRRPALEREEPQ